MPDEDVKNIKANYPAIIGALDSPLSFFGLAMLICNAVFSLAAAFIYSIHTFLAIVFAFIVIAIWSPRSLYRPADLANLEHEVPEIKNSRLIITFVILLSGFSYAGYQIYKLEKEQCGKKTSEKSAETEKKKASNNSLQRDALARAAEANR